jgi:hypothetical protein
MRNPADILRAAATSVLEGWCQESLSRDGRVCALGAVCKAATTYGTQDYLSAYYALVDVLPDTTSIAVWNDKVGQTAENVARTMVRAADRWEQEHADQAAPKVAWTARERVTA